MNLRSIRSRMLIAAIAPIVLVVVVIAALILRSRIVDLNEAQADRATLLLRQVSLASEYRLFSGNVLALQGVVDAVESETDVDAVGVFNATGVLLAHSARAKFFTLSEVQSESYKSARRLADVDVLVEPITTMDVPLDDLYAVQMPGDSAQSQILGYALLEMSRKSLKERERDTLLIILLMTLGGVVIGSVLASRLGDGVVRPVINLLRRIELIGQGDFSTKQIDEEDPLLEVQGALNMMAMQLGWTKEEMENRVAIVTEELRKKKEEAEAATMAKSRFLAAASHDLRQPTHALGMFVSRLSQFNLDAPVRNVVHSLEESVLAMQDLLDSLLDLSRLESGTVKPQVRLVPLSPMLLSVQKSLGQLALDKGLKFKVRMSDMWVLTDPALLQRMIMNLTHNALRYTEKGTVLVSCRPVGNGRAVRIDVSDSGIGIAVEHQESIYTEFYQVANAARERGQGLGLGLNIVQRSARLLGHSIDMRSALAAGTRFSITLLRGEEPKGRVPDLEDLSVTGDLASGDLVGLRVLVIENDPLACEALSLLLKSWGCIVFAAESIREARSIVNSGVMPQFLISDYRLGEEGTGLQAISEIRLLLNQEIPACLISGDTDASVMRMARDFSLLLLHKPVRPAKLRNLLRRRNQNSSFASLASTEDNRDAQQP